jgi:hypothetical protein
MKELEKSQWAWTLYEADDGSLVLSVICGTVGLYEVKYPLTFEDHQQYMIAGTVALNLIADKVRSHPERYSGRRA